MNSLDARGLRRIADDAMRARGLRPDFAPAVQAELEARAAAGPDTRGDVRDQRALPWFSIDNDDTRDLDQLSCAETLPGGATLLRVAVADVDAWVRQGGAVDEHAAANTTSVYTAAGVYPMLPERLSTDLSSLHLGQERLAVVVQLQIDGDGNVSPPEIHRAMVQNRAKLAYDGVSAWLDGRGPLPAGARGFEAQLRLHDAVADRLRGWRHRRGALNLATVSARPVFDAQGTLIDLRGDGRNRAKDLIADLMIATNGATARFLSQHQVPSLRRFLQSPARWDRIVELATPLGGRLPPAPDAAALDAFLAARRAADQSGYAELSLAVVKLLGSGAYTAEAPAATPATPTTSTNGGHFGLAVADYAHSTAPNRRFPDLVTQRLLKAVLAAAEAPYDLPALQAIAEHCTRQENMANKVERQVMKMAGAYLLQHRIGDCFDGLVTGTPAKGTFARIERPLVEGRVVSRHQGLQVGDRPRLRLVAVDLQQGHIDFERC